MQILQALLIDVAREERLQVGRREEGGRQRGGWNAQQFPRHREHQFSPEWHKKKKKRIFQLNNGCGVEGNEKGGQNINCNVNYKHESGYLCLLPRPLYKHHYIWFQ